MGIEYIIRTQIIEKMQYLFKTFKIHNINSSGSQLKRLQSPSHYEFQKLLALNGAFVPFIIVTEIELKANHVPSKNYLLISYDNCTYAA